MRGSRAQATRARGTGLGLVMCRRYATVMRGEVGAEPEPGGNRFWLRVPLTTIPAPPPAEPTPRGLRVLAIEDENYNRLVLGGHLTALGCEADWATSAAEAADQVRGNAYQVIISDCSLPDASGATVINALHDATNGHPPPIIVVSAYATAEMRSAVIQAGARLFVSKPISRAKLEFALSSLNLGRNTTAAPESEPGAQLNFDRLLILGPANEILPRFAADVTANFEQARANFDRDPVAAIPEVHKLRTTLLLVGASTAVDLLRVIENLAATNPDIARSGPLWTELEQEIDAVVAAVRAATNPAGPSD
ncbi:MAG: hypothetical protein RIS54_1190 [Verrucomicrobiota bacterium]